MDSEVSALAHKPLKIIDLSGLARFVYDDEASAHSDDVFRVDVA